MTLITFLDITNGLESNASLESFTCIAFLSDQPGARCTNSTGLRLQTARELIHKGIKTCAKLRELISCLLCEKDLKSTKFSDVLLEQWCAERHIPYIKRGRPRKSSGLSPRDANGSRTGSRSTSTSRRSKSPCNADVQPDTPCPTLSELIEDANADNDDHEQASERVDTLISTKKLNESYHRQISIAQTEAHEAASTTSSVKSGDECHQMPPSSIDDDSTSSHDFEQATYPEAISQSGLSVEEADDFSNDFLRGEACDWDPAKVRHNLLESLLRPLNFSPQPKASIGGYVYAAPVLGYKQAIVKIGHTANAKPIHAVDTRLKGLRRGHGVQLDLANTVAFFGNSKAILRRLEETVHDELAEYQLNLRLKSTKAKEYYAVDRETAEATISCWKERMDRLGFVQGCSLDPRLRSALTLRHEAFLPTSRDAKATWFRQRLPGRLSHEERQKMWRIIFQDDDGGVKATLRAPSSFGLSITLATLIVCFALQTYCQYGQHCVIFVLLAAHHLRTDWASYYSTFLSTTGFFTFLLHSTGENKIGSTQTRTGRSKR